MDQVSQMQILLKKIDDCLKRKPASKSVGIREGELKDIESLLYILKGEGVIGLFDSTAVHTSNKENSLEDWVYFFDVDKENLKKFKKGIRKSTKVYSAKYDARKMIINCGDKEIPIPPDTNISGLCKYMFDRKIDTPISWDDVYEEITGSQSMNKEKDRKKIYDAVVSANKAFKRIFPDQILFDWRSKSIVRVL